MAVTAEELQGLLENAWEDREADARTLREQLRFRERELEEIHQTGSIQSVNKNSAGQTNSSSGPGLVTTAEKKYAFRQLINLYDRCADLLSSAVDADIYAEMRARLSPVYATRPDLRNLRQCV